MALSNDLVSQFVRVTNDRNKSEKETTIVYGVAKKTHNPETNTDEVLVMLDGSDIWTPVSHTVDVADGERVTVMIKNHTATITGNITAPSARKKDVDMIIVDTNRIFVVENLLANKVDTDDFNAQTGRIDTLVSDNVLIKENLYAQNGEIVDLKSDNVTIKEQLTAANADIDNLETSKLDAGVAEITYALISDLEVTNADIDTLEAEYGDFASLTVDRLDAIDASLSNLDVENLDAKYANIDFSNIGEAAMENFYAKSGLIEDVVVGDGVITGRLVGVTISGDLIEGNTVVAEKLVIKGEDGLYYKLNTDGMTTEAGQTDHNSLNGSIIKAKSITATKVDVSDLVAFDATIGGFNITENSIYSGVKSAVENTTRGIYLDKDGQIAFGDSSNFIKYYKDTDGSYKLSISAESMLLSASGKTIEQAVYDNINIGGRNLFSNSKNCSGWVHNDIVTFEPAEADGFTIINFGDVETASYNRVSPIPNVPYSVVRDKTITISLYVRANSNSMETSHYNSILCSIGIATSATGNITIYKDYWLKDANGYYALPTEWEKRSLTLNITDSIFSSGTGEITDDSYFVVSFYRYNLSGAQLKAAKLEIGNKPTDWTPSPDDMASTEDLSNTNEVAERANETANKTEDLCQEILNSISMLVTDGSGTSLMTQTANGWTFSTAEIQASVTSLSQGLDSLINDLGDTNGTVNVLKQAVDDLGIIAEYVKIGTYDGEPCIELGESDSDFKLRITNTRILFMEGTGIPAYFTNQSMHIKKAVIEEELQQGGFVWKVRSNGNMGLVWKGASD